MMIEAMASIRFGIFKKTADANIRNERFADISVMGDTGYSTSHEASLQLNAGDDSIEHSGQLS